MNKVWSVNGAIAAQSSAHDRLMSAISEGRAVGIWIGSSRIATCESLAAAQRYVGKSKRYTIGEAGK